jgi:hypothetical protein
LISSDRFVEFVYCMRYGNSDDGIGAAVKELVAIYEKVGRLDAMKGEEGVRSRCVFHSHNCCTRCLAQRS